MNAHPKCEEGVRLVHNTATAMRGNWKWLADDALAWIAVAAAAGHGASKLSRSVL